MKNFCSLIIISLSLLSTNLFAAECSSGEMGYANQPAGNSAGQAKAKQKGGKWVEVESFSSSMSKPTSSAVKLMELKKQAKKAKRSKSFNPSKQTGAGQTNTNKQAKLLNTRFNKLNRKIINTKKADEQLIASFVAQYNEIETQADSFANASGTSEGKGKCMKECGTCFPGTGGGNGANRLACKLSCLILGE